MGEGSEGRRGEMGARRAIVRCCLDTLASGDLRRPTSTATARSWRRRCDEWEGSGRRTAGEFSGKKIRRPPAVRASDDAYLLRERWRHSRGQPKARETTRKEAHGDQCADGPRRADGDARTVRVCEGDRLCLEAGRVKDGCHAPVHQCDGRLDAGRAHSRSDPFLAANVTSGSKRRRGEGRRRQGLGVRASTARADLSPGAPACPRRTARPSA